VNLLLLDLDDTLVDRAGAFRTWAQRFVHQHGGSDTDVDRLVRLDAGGLAERESVAAGLRELLDIDVVLEDLIDAMLVGVVDESRSSEAIRASLRAASAAGWTPVVGPTAWRTGKRTSFDVPGLTTSSPGGPYRRRSDSPSPIRGSSKRRPRSADCR
jgi:hypothetical protein